MLAAIASVAFAAKLGLWAAQVRRVRLPPRR